ncbi:MAG: phage terminase, small subunit [Clostridiales bacterium]|jgi:phage terminase small subunit|nr:phage terminase, small subunit [Clostridiales bacterium]
MIGGGEMAKEKNKEQIEIKKDLLEQIERNSTMGKYYIDLINDYMDFWTTKNLLINDINERGVTCKYQNSETQWGYKKNDSVDQLLKVNQQMIKLLSALGIKPSQGGELNDDDEEM